MLLVKNLMCDLPIQKKLELNPICWMQAKNQRTFSLLLYLWVWYANDRTLQMMWFVILIIIYSSSWSVQTEYPLCSNYTYVLTTSKICLHVHAPSRILWLTSSLYICMMGIGLLLSNTWQRKGVLVRHFNNKGLHHSIYVLGLMKILVVETSQ